MTTIVLSLPVEVVIVRENPLSDVGTSRESLKLKEVCLPYNLEVYFNQKTGVLLIRPIDEPDDR